MLHQLRRARIRTNTYLSGQSLRRTCTSREVICRRNESRPLAGDEPGRTAVTVKRWFSSVQAAGVSTAISLSAAARCWASAFSATSKHRGIDLGRRGHINGGQLDGRLRQLGQVLHERLDGLDQVFWTVATAARYWSATLVVSAM